MLAINQFSNSRFVACLLTASACSRNGTLDLLIADTPVLDYYRATDHGCKLQRIGEHALNADTYAIGMAKGFPLKVRSICFKAIKPKSSIKYAIVHVTN